MRKFLASDSPQALGQAIRDLHLEVQARAMQAPNSRRRAFLLQVVGALILAEGVAELAGDAELEQAGNVRLLPIPPRP